MDGVLSPGARCVLGAEEEGAGGAGGSFCDLLAHVALPDSNRDSRAHGHCRGSWHQRSGAGDLAGTGHQPHPVGHDNSSAPVG